MLELPFREGLVVLMAAAFLAGIWFAGVSIARSGKLRFWAHLLPYGLVTAAYLLIDSNPSWSGIGVAAVIGGFIHVALVLQARA